MIKDIFKIGVYGVDLDLDIEPIKQYIEDYSQQHASVSHSNYGGWQSNVLEGSHLPLNNLFKEIQTHTNLYKEQLGISHLNTDGIYPWMNINHYRDYNTHHFHPDAIISGVFYVKTPKDCGDIHFVNPMQHRILLSFGEQTNFTDYNSAEYFMPAVANRLILFPGWLDHHVKPNMNQTESRISISFNCN